MNDSVFSDWPVFSDAEIKSVEQVLKSGKVNYWTGEICKKFESQFAEMHGCKYGIAVANGTVALELALRALGIGVGDEVVVTSRTFIASASAIVAVGAVPVFADVDIDSQNITAGTISEVISSKTKAVVCVHLAGWPCDMDPILDLCRKAELSVIEDCAQAHGAKYKGKPVGSLGDVGCWSFCQDKIMTTGGEGGLVATNCEKLWSSMWSFKDHGKSLSAIERASDGPGFRWVHESFGTNFRMTEMQAAIGLVQLGFLQSWTKKRNSNAAKIWKAASQSPWLKVPKQRCAGCDNQCMNECVHAAYKCYVFVNGNENDRNQILSALRSAGIPCFYGSCSEVYLEKAFDGSGFRPASELPIAKQLGETSLMFPCHPTMDEKEVSIICATLIDTVKAHFSKEH